MFRLRNWQGAAVVLACWGLLVPQTAVVADAPVATSALQQTQKSADVALTKAGLLVGAAYSPNGKHLDGAQVVITQSGKEIVRTNTDKNGAFAVAQLKSGAYQIGIGDKVAPIRVWTAETAPPKARQKAILVTGEIVRGQDETFESGFDDDFAQYDNGYTQFDDGFAEFGPDGVYPPDGGGPVLGLDVITLATVGGTSAAAAITIVNMNKLNKVEDQLDDLVSP